MYIPVYSSNKEVVAGSSNDVLALSLITVTRCDGETFWLDE